jgi:hypothetical protein
MHHPLRRAFQPEGEAMSAVQPRLPLILPQPARRRSVRRPFEVAGNYNSPYHLPRDVKERLTVSLAPYRNREAAYALALFLGRFHSNPARVLEAFPIDRRELADRPDLGLTEKRIRSAIRVLEEVGFLDRAMPLSGSRYRATEEGLQRKPILFMFGSDYAPAFVAANRRAAAARGRPSRERRPLTPTPAPRPSVARFEAAKGPKSTRDPERAVIMGPLRQSGLPPTAFEPNSKLESALENLLRGIRQSRGG